MHNIDPLLADFKSILEKTIALMVKLAELCQQDKSVRKTFLYKARLAVTHVEKKKTQIQQLIRRFIQLILQIVSVRKTVSIEGPYVTDWLYALECVDSFNKVRGTILPEATVDL